jgi:hypothetical protein
LEGKEIVGDTLQGVPDSLVCQTLCERYRGHTIFVHFLQYVNSEIVKNVILPLQRELADLDIVWVNVYNSNIDLKHKYAGWDNAKWLRYYTKLQGEHYYYNMTSRMDWIKDFNKTMGITQSTDAYCIVSPAGRIVRNSDSKPVPIWWMNNEDYLGIRQCLLQTAFPLRARVY